MKKQGNRGLLWSFVVIFIVLLFDQILKIWVKTNMTLGQEIPVIGHWFNLLFIENNGMAFGWLGGGGFLKLALSLFRIVAIVALFWILVRLSKKNTKFGVLFGLALITAGAMGNILDSVFYGRIFSDSTYSQVATLFPDGGGYAPFLYGRVVDMIYVKLFPIPSGFPVWGGTYFFPAIFNFADTCVTVGVALLIIFNKRVFKEERVEEDGVKE